MEARALHVLTASACCCCCIDMETCKSRKPGRTWLMSSGSKKWAMEQAAHDRKALQWLDDSSGATVQLA